MGLSHLMHRDVARPREWIAALAAYGGILLALRPGAEVLQWSCVAAGGAGLCLGLYLILTNGLQRTESVATNLFYAAVGALIPLAAVVPAFWQTPPLGDGVRMVAIGLLGFLSLLAIERAVERAPISRLAPIAFAQPLSAMVASRLFVGGSWDAVATLGGVLVVVSLAYLLRAELRGSSGSGR
jgi:drug/metabolite transporter (DMT)-like permease